MPQTHTPQPLKLLPAYLGVTSLDEALQHPRIARILWLEILVNHAIDWATLTHPLVQQAYQTACRLAHALPLPHLQSRVTAAAPRRRRSH